MASKRVHSSLQIGRRAVKRRLNSSSFFIWGEILVLALFWSLGYCNLCQDFKSELSAQPVQPNSSQQRNGSGLHISYPLGRRLCPRPLTLNHNEMEPSRPVVIGLIFHLRRRSTNPSMRGIYRFVHSQSKPPYSLLLYCQIRGRDVPLQHFVIANRHLLSRSS